MELGSRTGQGADCCMVYPDQYPLEAGDPFAPYQDWHDITDRMHYWGPSMAWWGIYPPYFCCPYWNGRTYTWTDSTGRMGVVN